MVLNLFYSAEILNVFLGQKQPSSYAVTIGGLVIWLPYLLCN